jgi:hypothetical protein
MNLPHKKEILIIRHEWVIGDEYSEKTTARDLQDGVRSAENDMKALGVDLSYDNAYHMRAGDGGQIVLFVEISS